MSATGLKPTLPEPSQERSEATRDALLRATISLLARGGARAVTHRAVADEAGAAHGSTRYYFASRDVMIRAALRKLAAEDVATIRAELERLPRGPAEPERIAATLAALLAERIRVAPDREIGRYELFLLASREPLLRPDLEDWGESYRELFTAHLKRLGSADPATDAHLMLSLGNALLLEQIAMQRPEFEREVLRPAFARFLKLSAAG